MCVDCYTHSCCRSPTSPPSQHLKRNWRIIAKVCRSDWQPRCSRLIRQRCTRLIPEMSRTYLACGLVSAADCVISAIPLSRVFSLFAVCRLHGRWPPTREPELADMEPGNTMLRITATTYHYTGNWLLKIKTTKQGCARAVYQCWFSLIRRSFWGHTYRTGWDPIQSFTRPPICTRKE